MYKEARGITADDIGKTLYPCDNSYIHRVEDNKEMYLQLAACATGDSKPVKIVSMPYMFTFTELGMGELTHEFVDVEYEGVIYRVLNTFVETPNKRHQYNWLD
jgi:hypothetical protein